MEQLLSVFVAIEADIFSVVHCLQMTLRSTSDAYTKDALTSGPVIGTNNNFQRF